MTIDELRDHRQRFPTSCAASGMEVILKLHGLINGDDFRYQDRFRGENIGFRERGVLGEFNIEAQEEWLQVDQAIGRLIAETKGGRFPLVALHVDGPGGVLFWHILVATQFDLELALIEPSQLINTDDYHTTSTASVSAEFQKTQAADLDRNGINILTYSRSDSASESN